MQIKTNKLKLVANYISSTDSISVALNNPNATTLRYTK